MAILTGYSARFDLPDLIARGRATTLACRVYRAGELAVPTGGTITILTDDGTAVVSAAAVTIADGIATYTVAASATTQYSLGMGWSVAWTLTMPDGEQHTYRNDAALVADNPEPVVTERTLYARCPALDPRGRSPVSARVEYSSMIDEAWVEIQQRLLAMDRRPWKIVSSSSLREPHLLLTLALVYEDLAARLNPAHAATAESYRRQYEASWARVEIREYDDDEDGVGDGRRAGSRGPIWLG